MKIYGNSQINPGRTDTSTPEQTFLRKIDDWAKEPNQEAGERRDRAATLIKEAYQQKNERLELFNMLSRLPDLSKMSYLKVLRLPCNSQLTNVDLSNMFNLEEIDLQGCALESFTLSGLPKLKSLNLSRNQLT